jgi:starvation-inducible DNA-binding protein
MEMVKSVLDNHNILLQQMTKIMSNAEEIKDERTMHLIWVYMRALEKSSWMLDAYTKFTATELNESFV